MGYFASLARQSGIRPGGQAAAPAPPRGIEVEATRTAESTPSPMAPAPIGIPAPAAPDRQRPIPPAPVEADSLRFGTFELTAPEEREAAVQIAASKLDAAPAKASEPPIVPEVPTPKSLPETHPSSARPKPPTLAEVRAWVSQPVPAAEGDHPLRGRAGAEPASVVVNPPPAPPAATIENHTLEIGSIHISFEESAPAKPLAAIAPPRPEPPAQPGNSPSRYYFR